MKKTAVKLPPQPQRRPKRMANPVKVQAFRRLSPLEREFCAVLARVAQRPRQLEAVPA